jgi:hypothetical protein
LDKEKIFSDLVVSTERTSYFWEKTIEQIQNTSKYCIFLAFTLFAALFHLLDNEILLLNSSIFYELFLKLSAVFLAASTLSLFFSILRSSEGLVLLHAKTFGKLVSLDKKFYNLQNNIESEDDGIFDEGYFSKPNDKFKETTFWTNTGVRLLGLALILASIPSLIILTKF